MFEKGLKIHVQDRCYKRSYRSKAKANKAMRLFGRKAGCKRTYRCDRHGDEEVWHLTSMEPTGE